MTQPISSQSSFIPVEPQTVYLQRARAILRQTLNRYTAYFRAARNHPPAASTQKILRADMDQLSITLNKLENNVARVAVFGLVSRGKSAVLNALLGQKVLPTGPLNGVTLTPQAVVWFPYGKDSRQTHDLQIELIDTPGLDEIDGQTRAEMAQAIAQRSDLILFVVAGDITRTEYQALCELRQAQKPLLLVFNKVDLYPEQSRQAIYQSLQRLATASADSRPLQRLLSTNEIVLIAAEPAPIQVRVEQLDGQIAYEWETPPPQVDSLKGKILEILGQEGRTLMALNALMQVREAESRLASKILEVHESEADALIWKFVRYKAIAIALNPVAVLDLVGGTVSDLAMIRALSELYGLPVTGHEAAKLWKTILLSSGSLLLTEIGSGIILGLGKSAAAAASGVDAASSLTAYAGTAIAQASFAGLGAYSVGRAVQVYLENGCSWGPQGANTVIQDILKHLDSSTILYRIRQELTDQLGLSP
ncbi:small GTP-binding protein [Leptolyngbyaceae cyanobacterium JSC-12]|nr:small GTP-binding protein [Leptolyngbyaceae cyanobacterium JSC-12]